MSTESEPTNLMNGMYNELLYHLDLCILAYHLYHQTLIWPMDPFYEQQAFKGTNRRENFMAMLRQGPQVLVQQRMEEIPSTYRGPGNFINPSWSVNPGLDPIITDYTRLNPWKPSFPKITQWEFIQPSKFITDKISSVFMYQRNPNPPNEGEPGIQANAITRPDGVGVGTDVLYCFEGGTGGIKQTGGAITPPAWSMMGFVLVRKWRVDDKFDVHIAFRGSRSGSAKRAGYGGLRGWGNPDWVTDMGWDLNTEPDPQVSPAGFTSNGFTQTIKSILPALIACFKNIGETNGIPQTIYVTGHSLGGALAALCASALAIGKPGECPADWPWRNLRLITFSAPTVGNERFSAAVNSHVYARRVNLAKDPITTTHGTPSRGGEHIGSKVELPPIPGWFKQLESHDYAKVREQLIIFLQSIGVNYFADRDTTLTQRYSNFLELYNAQVTAFNSTTLPVFDKHLKEYLNIFTHVAGLRSSYKTGLFVSESDQALLARKQQLQDLIKKLSNDSVEAENVEAVWTAAKWDSAEDVNNLLGLCLFLSLLAKNKTIDRLPESLRQLLMKI